LLPNITSPGNVIVFTGILPICQDEDGLAAVLGHEIGHVVMRHNSERMSKAQVLFVLAQAMDLVLGIDFGISRLIMTYLLDLPNSRTQELEADRIGLRLAARACFRPEAAPECVPTTFRFDLMY
jgi:metalloendopeptidase OMA1, mitochondrial